jgi:solute carrier family 25, member 38
MRTRMQADAAFGTLRTTAETAGAILREGGVIALWKGTQPTVIRLGIGAGLHFFFLESLKPLFQTRSADGSLRMTAVGAALTGGLSRAFAAVISCPITVVKTRMEYGGRAAAVPQYRNTLHALGTIAQTEGLRGLYRGLGPTVLSNAPFSALYYLFYTRLRDRMKTGPEPTAAVNFVSGAVSAIAATLITQPADVIRTRVQLGLGGALAGGSGNGTALLLRQVTQSQGARGLLVGAGPRMMKRTLQTALVWTLYEELAPRLTKLKDSMFPSG